MQANQSFTASGKQSYIGARAPQLQTRASAGHPRRGQCGRSTAASKALASNKHEYWPDPADGRGEGLLHDARNLVGTIGLYCDLLSMPGVLKPEHRQYPEELRLLGARSKSLIEHLMRSVFALEDSTGLPIAMLRSDRADRPSPGGTSESGAVVARGGSAKPVNLRSVVERCSGLLKKVANGRRVEITYGPAADESVSVPEEAVERILVNLVRNAAAAMAARSPLDQPSAEANSNGEATREAICIVVGSAVNRVGEHRPWPFQRVRLVVEDAGCGMSLQRLERLLSTTGERSRGGHGIGFGVVRDLVAASEGEIRVMSKPEMGTRVQIEWNVAAMPKTENATGSLLRKCSPSRRPAPAIGSFATSGRLQSLRDMRMAVAH